MLLHWIAAMLMSTQLSLASEPTQFDFMSPPSGEVYIERFRAEPENSSKPLALVIFSGFPAYGGKNEDLAQGLAKNLGADAYVLHYRGLGKSLGLFSFTGAVKDAADLIQGLRSLGYANIALVAHSFGGAVALTASHSVGKPPQAIVLISPLVELPPPSESEQDLSQFVQHEATLNHIYSLPGLLADSIQFGNQFQPTEAANSLQSAGVHLWVAQASNDNVTQASKAKSWKSKLLQQPPYAEFADDHWFSHSRAQLLDQATAWLVQWKDRE